MSGRGMTREASQQLVTVGPQPDVAALVRDLRKLYYVKGVELMLRVGELILERLYEGDVSKWKSRCRKDFSFRKLQQHPDLPFKASMLSRAVSMYVLSRRRADLLALQNVSQTHLQEVLNLDPAVQDSLLQRVEQEVVDCGKVALCIDGPCSCTAAKCAGPPKWTTPYDLVFGGDSVEGSGLHLTRVR